jgi:hypothetical protein
VLARGHALVGHVVRLAVTAAGNRDRVELVSHERHHPPASSQPGWFPKMDTRIAHDLARRANGSRACLFDLIRCTDDMS